MNRNGQRTAHLVILCLVICLFYHCDGNVIEIPEDLVLDLYSVYKDAVIYGIFILDRQALSYRRIYRNSKQYDVHVQKLKEVNGYKRHNLRIEEENPKNPIIYIDNPLETKLPNAFLTLEEFKNELQKRILRQREEFVKPKQTISFISRLDKKREKNVKLRTVKVKLKLKPISSKVREPVNKTINEANDNKSVDTINAINYKLPVTKFHTTPEFKKVKLTTVQKYDPQTVSHHLNRTIVHINETQFTTLSHGNMTEDSTVSVSTVTKSYTVKNDTTAEIEATITSITDINSAIETELELNDAKKKNYFENEIDIVTGDRVSQTVEMYEIEQETEASVLFESESLSNMNDMHNEEEASRSESVLSESVTTFNGEALREGVETTEATTWTKLSRPLVFMEGEIENND